MAKKLISHRYTNMPSLDQISFKMLESSPDLWSEVLPDVKGTLIYIGKFCFNDTNMTKHKKKT